MDNAELIEKYEGKIRQLMRDMKNDGIRDEVVHFVLSEAAKDVEMMIIARAEVN